jgi:hypothetical protein
MMRFCFCICIYIFFVLVVVNDGVDAHLLLYFGICVYCLYVVFVFFVRFPILLVADFAG